jgi:hypothetical protein
MFRRSSVLSFFAVAVLVAACSDDSGTTPQDSGPAADKSIIDSNQQNKDGSAQKDSGQTNPVECTGDCNEYVFSRIFLPSTTADATKYAYDFNGDGTKDNALGSIIAGLAAAAGGSFDVQGAIDEAVWEGSTLILLRLKAADLQNQSSVAAQAWLGEKQTCCSNPDNLAACKTEALAGCFSGTNSFKPAADSPTDALFGGSISSGEVTLGPGKLILKLPISASGALDLDLQSVRIIAKVNANGMTEGVLAGTITKKNLDDKVIPSLANLLDALIKDPAGDPAVKAQLVQLFDNNPKDGTITQAELAGNALIQTFLAGDVDTDGDGELELSLGIGFEAVIGDVSVGDVAVGDVAVGDVSVGDVSVGDVSVGDVSVGDVSVDIAKPDVSVDGAAADLAADQ